MIENLYAYLIRTKEDEIIIRTSHVKGCWDDNEFDAHKAGFNIVKFINPEYKEKHEFSECYKLTRRWIKGTQWRVLFIIEDNIYFDKIGMIREWHKLCREADL